MIIIQDTREQRPLKFDHEYVTAVRKVKLDAGDYGCEFKYGFVPPVFFERKSIPDLFGTLGKGYKRFKNEIVLAEELGLKLVIIIEGSLTKVLEGTKYSKMDGRTVVRKLYTLWLKYDIPFVCCTNRKECSFYICEYYASIGRRVINDLKAVRVRGRNTTKVAK